MLGTAACPLTYDKQRHVPVWASEPWTAYEIGRVYQIERRLADRNRSNPYDFEKTKFVPLALLSGNRSFACVAPVTTGCFERYIELDALIHAHLQGRVFVAQGTLFESRRKILLLREDDGPAIPHQIWRSVLCEFDNGRVSCWTFLFPNTNSPPLVESSIVATRAVEQKTGMLLWSHIRDTNFHKQKGKPLSRWW